MKWFNINNKIKGWVSIVENKKAFYIHYDTRMTNNWKNILKRELTSINYQLIDNYIVPQTEDDYNIFLMEYVEEE